MTHLEKLKQTHPNWDEEDIRRWTNEFCPSPYEESCNCPVGFKPLIDCNKCWNQEVSETEPVKTETNEREESTMNEFAPANKKTKAELLEDIVALKKQIEHLDRYKKYEECADELSAMRKAFVSSGFSEEEAFKLVIEMLRTAPKMAK